jgi:hypothetical protein
MDVHGGAAHGGAQADEASAVQSAPRFRVVDGQGAPMAGARAAWIDARSNVLALKLDQASSAVLPEQITKGRFYAFATGYASGFMRAEERQAGQDLELVLRSGGRLTGRLLVEGAEPGRSWSLRHQSSSTDYGIDVWASDDRFALQKLGAFELESSLQVKADGTFVVNNVPEWHSGILILPQALQLVGQISGIAAHFGPEERELRLDAIRLPTMRGRVLWNADGTPVRGHVKFVLEKADVDDSANSKAGSPWVVLGAAPARKIKIDADGYFEYGFALDEAAHSLPL